MSIVGSCLCQSIKYELSEAEFFPVENCHCENCRKTAGAAFGTYLAVNNADFKWLEGEALLTKYESSPLTYRCFCSRCGSPLVAYDDKEIRCITLGSTDDDPGVRPESHIYVSSKAPWYEIGDDLPQFDLRGPGTKPPVDTEAS